MTTDKIQNADGLEKKAVDIGENPRDYVTSSKFRRQTYASRFCSIKILLRQRHRNDN